MRHLAGPPHLTTFDAKKRKRAYRVSKLQPASLFLDPVCSLLNDARKDGSDIHPCVSLFSVIIY